MTTRTENVPSELAEPIRWAPLLALASGTATLVTSEFLPAGVLPRMAADLGVGLGTAGLAVAATAIAGALTAPSIAVALPQTDRRRVLFGLLVAGAVANAAVALAPSFGLLLLGRLVLGAALAGFWSFAFGAGTRAVPGRASVVSTAIAGGVSVATVIAVPVASIVSDDLDWRWAFWGAAALTLFSAAAVRLFLPSVPADPSAGWTMLRQTLARPRVMFGVGCVMLVAFGNFAAYPFIRVVIARIAPDDTTLLLVGWGLGGLVGTVAAGALSRWLRMVVAAAPLLLGGSLLLAASTSSMPALIVALLVWGFAFNAVPVSTQLWVSRVEPERIESAMSLQVMAFQVAITAGASLGGLLLDARGPVAVLVLGGSAAVLAGLGFAAIPLPRRRIGAPATRSDAVVVGEGAAEGGSGVVADRERDLCHRG